MSQLTRSALKSIIKECLIEILAEGLNAPTVPLTESLKSIQYKKSGNNNTQNITQQAARPENPNKKFNNSVADIARSLTDDHVMASVLEDTAKTTLQEQIENDRELMIKTKNMGGLVAPNSGEYFPEFDEKIASNWTALAFGTPKKR